MPLPIAHVALDDGLVIGVGERQRGVDILGNMATGARWVQRWRQRFDGSEKTHEEGRG